MPAFAVFYGVLLLDEPLTAASLGGLVLVVAGSALAARTPRTQPGAAAEDAAPDADSTLR